MSHVNAERPTGWQNSQRMYPVAAEARGEVATSALPWPWALAPVLPESRTRPLIRIDFRIANKVPTAILIGSVTGMMTRIKTAIVIATAWATVVMMVVTAVGARTSPGFPQAASISHSNQPRTKIPALPPLWKSRDQSS